MEPKRSLFSMEQMKRTASKSVTGEQKASEVSWRKRASTMKNSL